MGLAALSKYCSTCKQLIPWELIEQRERNRGKNVREGLARRKAAGLNVGRPKERDDKAILRLRLAGLTITQIAKELKCSRAAVFAAIKAARNE